MLGALSRKAAEAKEDTWLILKANDLWKGVFFLLKTGKTFRSRVLFDLRLAMIFALVYTEALCFFDTVSK